MLSGVGARGCGLGSASASPRANPGAPEEVDRRLPNLKLWLKGTTHDLSSPKMHANPPALADLTPKSTENHRELKAENNRIPLQINTLRVFGQALATPVIQSPNWK